MERKMRIRSLDDSFHNLFFKKVALFTYIILFTFNKWIVYS